VFLVFIYTYIVVRIGRFFNEGNPMHEYEESLEEKLVDAMINSLDCDSIKDQLFDYKLKEIKSYPKDRICQLIKEYNVIVDADDVY
jgi:hypothetical protein